MHPILFEFGKLRIYSYGAIVALGFITAILLAAREARRVGIQAEDVLDVGLYSLISGIVGARALHVLLEMRHYLQRPLEIIMINRGGLAIHGALIAGILTACIIIKRRGMPLWKTADVMIPYVALGQAIGRIGCLLNGCCYGIPTRLALGISLPGHLLKLHPTQLYTSLYLFFVFFALKKIYRKRAREGTVFIYYLLFFSFGRFFIDFLRGDLAAVFFGLRASQLISLAVFSASSVFLAVKFRRA